MSLFEIYPNWHIIWIHFSFSPILLSFITFILSIFLNRKSISQDINKLGHWLLLIGAIGSFLATVSGQIAYGDIDHDMQTHLNMIIHLKWAWLALLLIIFCAGYSYRTYRDGSQVVTIKFLLVYAFAVSLLVMTFNQGRIIVYEYGGGVDTLPNMNIKCEQYNNIKPRKRQSIFELN